MTVLELVRESGTPFLCGYSPNGGYERRPDTFHLRFDPESESASQAVVKAAAFVHNAEPTDLSPLAGVLDPDALNTLIGEHDTRDAACLEATFIYEDLEVTVTSDGDVWLTWD